MIAPLRRGRTTTLLVIAAVISLLAIGAGFNRYSDKVFESQEQQETVAQARILAGTVSAALSFDDETAAQESVDALQANPEVVAVAVYAADGRRFVHYARDPQLAAAPHLAAAVTGRVGSHLIITAPVAQKGVNLGTVWLRTETEPPARRYSRLMSTLLFGGMTVLLLALLAGIQIFLARANAALAQSNQNLQDQIVQRERAEAALRQSQKMEAMGQLTGGVAHDFNNILMVASSGLDLLERTPDPTRRARLLTGMRQALDRGADLTRQLLAFARRASLRPVLVDVAARLSGMRVLLDRSLREDVTVEILTPPDLWPIEVDPSQFEVAILNLAVNARDAMPDGGRITIRAVNSPGRLEGRDAVCISVSDTGVGIPEEALARVFEPFFTTKEVGKGTGLGLSQVYGFCRASGGETAVDSKLGEGATVTLCLPRGEGVAAPAETADRPALLHGRGRLLVVEDDDGVAAVVEGMLAALGYDATRAETAAAALAILEQESFDLVLSDMVMPGTVSGLDLARTVRERWAATPVVLSTGFSEAARQASDAGFPLLLKPYSIEALGGELTRALTLSRNQRNVTE